MDLIYARVIYHLRYTSLFVYQLLEKKLKDSYTCEEIFDTLRGMQIIRIAKDIGYIPSYKRTDLTDSLHKTFGFRTNFEFISRSTMQNIIKNSKIINEQTREK